MIRAGVFIGVNQTGGLQRLRDAASGAASMHAWACAQGMKPHHAKLITDDDGRTVTPDDIYAAIKEIIDGPGADQLIVYFAGHGVNMNKNEHWLLTDAPGRTSAAVDVSSSVELARYSGIRHVVFISDACRVAPEGIQAQSVRGVDVFPNDGAGDRAKPVDQFFACLLGRTAAEVRDPAAAANSFRALYTHALVDALSGLHAQVLEEGSAGDSATYVRPRRLQAFLETEISSRVQALGVGTIVNQEPDAIITSDGHWLARIAPVPPGPPVPAEDAPAPAVPGPLDAVRELTHGVAEWGGAFEAASDQLRGSRAPATVDLVHTLDMVGQSFGPDHFESECGIKVRGSAIADVLAPGAAVESLTGELVRVHPVDGRAVSAVVQLAGGSGLAVPMIPGFLVGLTFQDDELVDVAYEPSANTWRWALFAERADEYRALRSVAASSSRHGRFALEGTDAAALARRMQLGKGIDPTLAVYAAYAYHDLQHVDRIREMSGFLRDDLDVSLFDVDLLARRLVGKTVDRTVPVAPFTPLLARGWSLLRAHRVRLHPALDDLSTTLLDSTWCLYSASGVARLKQALATGDVR